MPPRIGLVNPNGIHKLFDVVIHKLSGVFALHEGAVIPAFVKPRARAFVPLASAPQEECFANNC
jgi:hypothetical protein